MPAWYEDNMSFREFAFLKPIINYQAKFLEGTDLSTFGLVRTTENLECFCRFFDPEETVGVSRLNAASRQEVDLSGDFMSRFKRGHQEDYRLYEIARERARELVSLGRSFFDVQIDLAVS